MNNVEVYVVGEMRFFLLMGCFIYGKILVFFLGRGFLIDE